MKQVILVPVLAALLPGSKSTWGKAASLIDPHAKQATIYRAESVWGDPYRLKHVAARLEKQFAVQDEERTRSARHGILKATK